VRHASATASVSSPDLYVPMSVGSRPPVAAFGPSARREHPNTAFDARLSDRPPLAVEACRLSHRKAAFGRCILERDNRPPAGRLGALPRQIVHAGMGCMLILFRTNVSVISQY
jgi:hypothetical protein